MGKTESKKLFLLDAFALIFRAYYAFINNPRINSKGLNTSAIFGFTNTLDEILKKEKPSHIAVVFDPPNGSFRKEIYPEYKGQRKPTPEDIIKSVPYIKRIIEGYNIPVIEVENYEADDTIGALAKQAEKENFEVFMMTPDKDYAQLLSDKVKMYKPARSGKKAEIIAEKDICEKYNIGKAEQFIEILALMGDTADNIKGVPGVGEKTAAKLISEYGSIDNIYENIDKIKGKLKEKILNSRALVNLAKTLVTIALDVPIEFDPELLSRKEMDKEKLQEVFNELEFRTMSSRIIGVQNAKTDTVKERFKQTSLFGDVPEMEKEINLQKFKSIYTTDHQYYLVHTEEERKNLIKKLSLLEEFCFDTETTGLKIHGSEIVGIAFSFKKHEAYYLYLPDDFQKAKNIIHEFKQVFENEKIQKIGQNIKFDILMLKNYEIEVQGSLFDTMIAHYLLRPELAHNFNALAQDYLNYQPVKIEELIGAKGKNQKNMRGVNAEKVKEYAGEDADITYQLKLLFEPMLQDKSLLDLARKIEMPLIYVLANMEYEGVSISKKFLNEYALVIREKLIGIEKEIFNLSGLEFNISSPKQLGEILFDRLKIITNAKKTKTGQYATGESELVKLKDKHEIINKILYYRGLQKLLNTYVESLPDLINPKTHKIHTSFNQAITATGRLSSSNPNLQNIPIRTLEGREIRKAFVPTNEGNKILSADYSQVELRLMAHMSGDENMIHDFKAGEDIHRSTAAKIFNVKIDEVDKEMRSMAKSANFGIIYGISAFGLAQNLNIRRSEAKELIEGYFKSYPKVKEYMDKQIAFAREKAYVLTMKGRRRYLPDINSRNSLVRGVAERNAINAPIQGSAADVIKIAMISIDKILNKENYKSKLLLQVHDELVFDADANEVDKLKKIVVSEMEKAISLSVPLIADCGIGNNWLEAH